MKRFIKFFLILAVVFVTIGIGFTIAGVSMGVSVNNLEEIMEGENVEKMLSVLEDMGMTLETQHILGKGNEKWNELTENGEHISYKGNKIEREYDIPFSEINTIMLDLNGDEVQFQECSSDKLRITIENDAKEKIEVIQNKEILIIQEKGTLIEINSENPVIQIEYPRNMELQKLQLMIGAGEVDINSDLKAEIIQTELGAGEINVNNRLTCTESNWKVGAGELNIQNLDSRNTVFECGLGEIHAKMKGKQKEYNYQISCGIGEIKIGKDKFSGLAKEEKVDNHAVSDLRISCGIGEVELSFS